MMETLNERTARGKAIINEIEMICDNDPEVTDRLVRLLELFNVNGANDPEMNPALLAENLHTHLFTWTHAYGDSFTDWKNSVVGVVR